MYIQLSSTLWSIIRFFITLLLSFNRAGQSGWKLFIHIKYFLVTPSLSLTPCWHCENQPSKLVTPLGPIKILQIRCFAASLALNGQWYFTWPRWNRYLLLIIHCRDQSKLIFSYLCQLMPLTQSFLLHHPLCSCTFTLVSNAHMNLFAGFVAYY